MSAAQVIRRLQRETASVPGISLYMQPAQDLTIDSAVSRTQYQFTLESANPDELSEWAHRLASRLSELPQLADVASDLQDLIDLQLTVAESEYQASQAAFKTLLWSSIIVFVITLVVLSLAKWMLLRAEAKKGLKT